MVRKAAEGGEAKVQFAIGGLYYHGIDDTVEQDREKGLEMLLKAADQDHAGAQMVLGYIYEAGDGTGQDLDKAAFWYGKAAENGDEEAADRSGRLHR